jgi:8-oxo-dGTP pyrophosphatase MutT (NUDIX family)
MSYDETAIKECQEETGLDVDLKDLVFLGMMKKKIFHENGLVNYTIRAQYAYLYQGSLSDLKVESGEGAGFEAWNIDDLSHLSEEQKNRFIPLVFEDDMLELFQKAKKLLNLD